jgi:hypothetical protein
MRQLSQAGQQAVSNIAQRYGFSLDAGLAMLDAVINGNGSMAQFNHYEFSGSGQWMRGGMIMISDMFNNYLKGQIDGLCSELSNLVANQPDLVRSGSFQSQSQGNQSQRNFEPAHNNNSQQQNNSNMVSLFVPPAPGTSGNWWPADIGYPNSTGAQNDVRYAYFQQACRLAIEVNGTVTVYNTLDHQIGGFSQQQSYGGSISFSSQYGLVSVASLPVVSINGVQQFAPAPVMQPEPFVQQPVPNRASNNADFDIFAAINKLADLRNNGILTDSEFAAKKSEVLSRL